MVVGEGLIMAKYLLKSEDYEDEIFSADDDSDAQDYVEENYDLDDGSMTLYRLTPICSWT